MNEKLAPDITLTQSPQIIHGDASLNNCMKDKHNQIALLDFELARLGYPVEDWAEFLLSSLYQHQVFFFPTKKLKILIEHLNGIFNFVRLVNNYLLVPTYGNTTLLTSNTQPG